MDAQGPDWNLTNVSYYSAAASTRGNPLRGPNMIDSDLERTFAKLIQMDNEIISELIDLLISIQEYQKSFRIVRTTGTSVGAIGAMSMVAGLCLAPATAGASAILSMGGLVATATSGATAIGSGVVNHIKNTRFLETIEKLQEKQRKAATELTLKLGLLNCIVDELTDSGVSEEVAVRTTLQIVKDQIIELFQGPDGEYSAKNITSIAARVVSHMNTVRDLTSTTIALGTATVSLQEIARDVTAALSDAAAKVGQVTANELRGFRGLMRSAGQSITSTTGRSVLRGIGVAAGIIFTVVDVALLVREWRNPHPLIRTIQNIVEDLAQDITKCEESKSVLLRLENYPQYGLPKVSI